MVCWHRRYTLGDVHAYPDPQTFTRDYPLQQTIWLPLYLLDHSGLAISTSNARFRACDPAGWDWGQVGYVYITPAKVREEYGVKRITAGLRARVETVLRAEVDTYDQYLRGEVYGYRLTDRQTGEVIDTCWGFYGENPHHNGMAESLPFDYQQEILSYFHRDAA
jgi:hypothetical protein